METITKNMIPVFRNTLNDREKNELIELGEHRYTNEVDMTPEQKIIVHNSPFQLGDKVLPLEPDELIPEPLTIDIIDYSAKYDTYVYCIGLESWGDELGWIEQQELKKP